ncbi:MAG: hypothetical protein V3V20_06210 [Algisphaera sp.]
MPVSFFLQNAALRMLTDDDAPILEIARRVTAVCREAGLEAAVIGGVAVFLHGYERTTVDVDTYCGDREAVAVALRAAGFSWHPEASEFRLEGVPVHLLNADELGHAPAYLEERRGIQTVSLGELLTLKLRTGVRCLTRAQDLADAVKLIRIHKLNGSYANRIGADVRAEFKSILKELG